MSSPVERLPFGREVHYEEVVSEAVHQVYKTIWTDNGLTREQKLHAWTRVIVTLVEEKLTR